MGNADTTTALDALWAEQRRLSKSDKARGANAGQVREQREGTSHDSHAPGATDQALLTLDGQDYARQYMARLRAGSARPGELAMLIAFLHSGPMLEGACRALEKALKEHRHAA